MMMMMTLMVRMMVLVIITGDIIFIIIIFPVLTPIGHMVPIIIILKHGISECGTSLKCGNT